MVFTTRLSGRKGGRNAPGDRAAPPERHPEELPPEPPHHLRQSRTRPADDERLAARPTHPAGHRRRATASARRILVEVYNHDRPHRSLPHRATPATIYDSLPKAAPTSDRAADTHDRVRHDKIDDGGAVTLRVNGRLHHIGVGRTHARTPVILLVHDLEVRIVAATTGELLRELTIDHRRDYQPTGRRPGPRRTQK